MLGGINWETSLFVPKRCPIITDHESFLSIGHRYGMNKKVLAQKEIKDDDDWQWTN